MRLSGGWSVHRGWRTECCGRLRNPKPNPGSVGSFSEEGLDDLSGESLESNQRSVQIHVNPRRTLVSALPLLFLLGPPQFLLPGGKTEELTC